MAKQTRGSAAFSRWVRTASFSQEVVARILADRLQRAVKQTAVSRWMRGATCPPGDVQSALFALAKIDPALWSEVAPEEAPTSSSAPPPQEFSRVA